MPFLGRQLQSVLSQPLEGNLGRVSPTNDYFLACIPEKILQNQDRDVRIDSLVAKNGFLLWQPQTGISEPRVVVREVSPRFDAKMVQGWLHECQTSHPACLPRGSSEHLIKLIDCSTRRVISVSTLDTTPEYVALSYVWGEHIPKPGDGDGDSNATAQVIEDALSVTKSLGHRYLWVDKYCVDQDDSFQKHEQIMNMDSIYENASLTIIAAAGLDHSRGLPGISSNRLKKEIPFQHENFSLSWIPPSPHKEILESRWSTRGWTYQEAVLSRRRLVFTDRQVYFECRSMACYESLRIPLQDLFPSSVDIFRLPQIFSSSHLKSTVSASSVAQAAQDTEDEQLVPRDWKMFAFNAYTRCAERYSQRTLTFESDSLNAFGGMIKRFESLEQGTLRHLWGIPFFDPRDDQSPDDIVDYAGFLLAGLCWRHESRSKSLRRRNMFPSWSWTGWEGAVTWPKVDASFEVQASDLYTLSSIQLSFEDGSTRSIPDVRDKRPGGDRLGQYPKALLLQTSAVSGYAFPFKGPPLTTNQSPEYTWYPSVADLDVVRMVQQLQSGDLKALRLGIVGKVGFLLVVKKRKSSFYRVGLIQVCSALITESIQTHQVRAFKIK